MLFCVESDIMVKVFRGVAQVVERYFREVEAASSSLVTPIEKNLIITGVRGYQVFFVLGESGLKRRRLSHKLKIEGWCLMPI